MKNEIKRTGTARKVGRPRAYTPEALEAKFEEYVEWVKARMPLRTPRWCSP